MNFLLAGIYIVFGVIDSIFLLTRAIKLKNIAIYFLAFTFLAFIIANIVNIVINQSYVLFRSLIAVWYPILLIIFTKLSFYIGKKSKFKFVISVAISLHVIQVIEMNLFGFSVPSFQLIHSDSLWIYYFHVMLVVSQLCVSFSWLFWASF